MYRSYTSLMLCLLLTHCAAYDFTGRITQQGNLLPNKSLHRLKPGLSKTETIAVMGDSLLHNPFNPNRLDYAYTLQKQNRLLKGKHTIITFKQNRLNHVAHVDLKHL